MVKKALVLVSTAAVAAVLVAGVAGVRSAGRTQTVYASSLAGIFRAGESAVQIQNLDTTEMATIGADFYKSAGAWQQTINLPHTAPGSAANFWMPASSLPTAAYAATVHADRQVAAIVRTDWPASGGAAIYSNVIPGKNVVLPLAVRNYFGQSSVVSIQNTDTGFAARVTVDFFASGASTPTASQDYSIPAGTSITLDLHGHGDPLEFESLGTFIGSLFVTSATDVGVMSFVDIATSDKAVYGFEGVPVEMASPTLYAPLFRAMQFVRPGDPTSGRIDSGISVTNPGLSPVNVTITYRGAGGTCAGETVTSPPATIGGHSSHVFYQGDPASQGLKAGCYGSAVIQSSGGGIVAIVNEAQNLNQTAAAYNAVPASQGATTVALPLYRKDHANGLTTGISVMNMSTDPAEITVTFNQALPAEGSVPVVCGAACTQTAGANQTAIFWPGSISEIPKGTYGSATVQSSQPVAVIVNDVNVWGATDMATYNGIKADFPLAPGVSGVSTLPVMLNERW